MGKEKQFLGFLQNAWHKDPERVRGIYAKHPNLREDLVARFLFAGCYSGKVFKNILGKDLCDQFVWEETTKEIADYPTQILDADLDHIKSVIAKHSYVKAIICFGRFARIAVESLTDLIVMPVYKVPHPAHRDKRLVVTDYLLLKDQLTRLNGGLKNAKDRNNL